MKRWVIYLIILVYGTAVFTACPVSAQDGDNPSFLAVYLPQGASPLDRKACIVEFAEQSINGVFARKGFRVLDRTLIETAP